MGRAWPSAVWAASRPGPPGGCRPLSRVRVTLANIPDLLIKFLTSTPCLPQADFKWASLFMIYSEVVYRVWRGRREASGKAKLEER